MNLGATEFIEKPVDFELLKTTLAAELRKERPERRAHVRVPLRVIVTLIGGRATAGGFEEVTMTENSSAGGFLCTTPRVLQNGSVVEVFLGIGTDRLAGCASVVRQEAPRTPWQRYAFRFLETTQEWVLHRR
jgi:hypothetical protein